MSDEELPDEFTIRDSALFGLIVCEVDVWTDDGQYYASEVLRRRVLTDAVKPPEEISERYARRLYDVYEVTQ